MIPPRTMITRQDIVAVENFLLSGAPLSGYLAGSSHGGQAVQRLEEIWRKKFRRGYAICCNSATSGLLAACMALGVNRRTKVAVPTLSMSATAAVPRWLGAELDWLDCDNHGGAEHKFPHDACAAIVTTLFGHPIGQEWIGEHCLIIDNAQGILSGYDSDIWTENVGDICVTSFNVHKQINAGEMGIITTDNPHFDEIIRHFINHGECAEDAYDRHLVGLNLRPTEISAVLALSQLSRIGDTIGSLQHLADSLTKIMPSGFSPILPRTWTKSAWYCYAFRVSEQKRDAIIEFLNANGVPCSAMYKPIYHLPAFERDDLCLPAAEKMSHETIVFELCAWRYEDDLDHVALALGKAAKL